MRALVAILALGLAACATQIPSQCVSPRSAQQVSAADQGFTLAGRVASLLAAGKLSPTVAISLNQKLQTAQADIRAGKTAEAQALIDSVKGELP